MKCKIIDSDHGDLGLLDLDPSIFGVDYRADILHQVVKWQLAKRRSGNHKTKGISEISGTTAKPYKQKRTGRARQGSLRSPQFRGGAVIFGPVVRSHEYNLNKKVRKLGLRVALSLKFSQEQVVVLDDLSTFSGKTSEMAGFAGGFSAGKSVLIVSDVDTNILKACSNIHLVDVIKTVGLNVYDILKHDNIVITKNSLSNLESRLS